MPLKKHTQLTKKYTALVQKHYNHSAKQVGATATVSDIKKVNAILANPTHTRNTAERVAAIAKRNAKTETNKIRAQKLEGIRKHMSPGGKNPVSDHPDGLRYTKLALKLLDQKLNVQRAQAIKTARARAKNTILSIIPPGTGVLFGNPQKSITYEGIINEHMVMLPKPTKTKKPIMGARKFSRRDFRRGVDLLERGDYKRAASILEKYADRKLSHTAHNEIGVALHNVGEHERAIEQYKKAIKADPNNFSYNYNLGIVLHELRRNTEAEKYIGNAIQLNSMDSHAHIAMSDVLREQGKTKLAEMHINKAREISPSDEAFFDNEKGARLSAMNSKKKEHLKSKTKK